MSPKRKAAAQIHPSSKGESDSDNFDIDMPTWHDEPSEFALWHNRLPEYLIDYDESFQSLVQYGFCWSKHVMCFSSTNHMQRYRQNMLVAGTFSAPTIIPRTAAVVLSATPVDLATATAAAKEAELLELKRFSNNPEQVDKKDKEMARVIAKKMSNPSSRKDWLKKANNSGRTLLQLLQAERARLDSDLQTGIGENVVNDIDDLFKAGVGEATVASFGEFDNNLTELLDILPSTLRPAYPEAVLARKYIAVISSLGERIENKLDGELDRTAAGSNLSKIKTAIRSVLSRHTAREQSLASTNGSAFRASQDPRKTPNAPRGGGGGGGGAGGGAKGKGDGAQDPKRPWEWRDWKKADGPCGHCLFLGKPPQGANHWRKSCPSRDEAIAARKAAKAAKVPPSGNGKGHMASHSHAHNHDGEDDVSDSDCSDCSEEENYTYRGKWVM